MKGLSKPRALMAAGRLPGCWSKLIAVTAFENCPLARTNLCLFSVSPGHPTFALHDEKKLTETRWMGADDPISAKMDSVDMCVALAMAKRHT